MCKSAKVAGICALMMAAAIYKLGDAALREIYGGIIGRTDTAEKMIACTFTTNTEAHHAITELFKHTAAAAMLV